VLIDEFETGVHHTLHAELWRTVFHAAEQLDVQVFATTHSWDCLRGFAEAVAEDETNDGVAIRLEKVEGEEQTGAVIIDREGLPVIVRDEIEVR
jgi:AAA15 family ATPase/GTPase